MRQGEVGYGGDPHPAQNNFPLTVNSIGHALTQMHTQQMSAIRTYAQSSQRALDKYANDAREREAAAFKDNRAREAAALRMQQENHKHEEQMLGQFIRALTDNLGNPTSSSDRIPHKRSVLNSSIPLDSHASDT